MSTGRGADVAGRAGTEPGGRPQGTAQHDGRRGPRLVRTRPELVAALADGAARGVGAGGPDGDGVAGRAVVMTMGALHEGHLALVRAARAAASTVVVTIFVNPLQFGPGEDLDRYPRDLAGDLALLSGPGLLGAGDVVFAPEPATVYPDGDPAVRVHAGPLGDVLEGAVRPGHLDGVLTVVLKLLHLVAPDVALFGRKDAQQLAAVRRMVRDLDVPVEIRPVPTEREADGLARSSRNAYLAPDARRRARALPAALAAAADAADAGAGAEAVVAAARRALAAGLAAGLVTGTGNGPAKVPGPDAVDYVALVDPDGFTPVPPDGRGAALLLLAARVGGTRLIDNAELVLRPRTADAAPGTAGAADPAARALP
ncbi:pantoate--beta-alanine ligase [Cellulomonas endophytica]|uniref:pantoate--beta-alanine ligase n=1 Tax=Cellulomonas endophytica TaxID=2494735 RepID=UPI0010127328|nr:pantoate--beta-alanine ligase [Cellulomonas endophytica]